MLKSMIVALDSSASSASAQKIAIELARQTGASLTGLGVLDVPWVRKPMATPIGGGAYKEHRDETLIEKGRVEISEKIGTFHQVCKSEGLDFGAVSVDGVPHEVIEAEADRYDLIVIGRDTNFHGTPEHDIARSVQHLLEDNPRPILVIPSEAKLTGKVVVAYDGSLQSSRAMHMFVLLGLAENREIHVVSVGKTTAEAGVLADHAATLFRKHGVESQVHALEGTGNPFDEIMGVVNGVGAGMLVMGAYGHHGFLHKIFIGSATDRMLRSCPVMVFVHH